MNDTSTFGSFTHAFLTRFRDEFTKLPVISFPIFSGVDPRHVDPDDVSASDIVPTTADTTLVSSLAAP